VPAAAPVGLCGRIDPEEMTPFGLRTVSAFHGALARGSLTPHFAGALTTVTTRVRRDIVRVTPITIAASIHAKTFNRADYRYPLVRPGIHAVALPCAAGDPV